MALNKIGVVHGRFQPLHNEHVKDLILPALNRSEHLLIGITNYETDSLIYAEENPHRSILDNNPFSYYDRAEFIRHALADLDIPADRYRITPFPITEPDKLKNYVPKDSIQFITVFDDWGRKKVKVLQDYGYEVNVLFERDLVEKKISSTLVRSNLASGTSITSLVPSAVSRLLSEKIHYPPECFK